MISGNSRSNKKRNHQNSQQQKTEKTNVLIGTVDSFTKYFHCL